ncbi:DUF2141 domain-containing protein [Spirosoma gilvum]
MFFLLPLVGLFLTNPISASSLSKTNLTIEVHNVQTLNGSVFIALFAAGKEFPSGKPIEGEKVAAASHSVQASFSVEPGEYAIAVFHDENGNGQLDKRIFGIPKEPYGFSNNFRPKMSAPKFTDCRFTVGTSSKTIRIKLD